MAFRDSVQYLSELVVDLFRSADPPNPRWEISSAAASQIVGYTGDSGETAPSNFQTRVDIIGAVKLLWTIITGPRVTNGSPNGAAQIALLDRDDQHKSQLILIADDIMGESPGGSAYYLETRVLAKGVVVGGTVMAVPVPVAVSINLGGGTWAGSRYTIPIAGYYRIYGSLKSDGAGGIAGVGIRVNGITRAWSPNSAAGAFQGGVVQLMTNLAAGTIIDLVSNGAGTTVNDAPAENSVLVIERIPIIAAP